jgi:hypothetical protein
LDESERFCESANGIFALWDCHAHSCFTLDTKEPTCHNGRLANTDNGSRKYKLGSFRLGVSVSRRSH